MLSLTSFSIDAPNYVHTGGIKGLKKFGNSPVDTKFVGIFPQYGGPGLSLNDFGVPLPFEDVPYENDVEAFSGGATQLGATIVTAIATRKLGGRINYSPPQFRNKASPNLSPNQIGVAGENAVRRRYGIGNKERIFVNGRNRIPDGLTKDTLSEVKNTARLSFTKQLRDYQTFANDTGRQFHLYIRPSTKLTGPLKGAAAEGKIIIRRIPPYE